MYRRTFNRADDEAIHNMLIELELRQPVLTERTSKRIKLTILIGLLIILFSAIPVLLLQDGEMRWSNSDIGLVLFLMICPIGIAVWLYGTFQAWWYHG